VREYLLSRGLAEGDLYPLKAPAGLDINARRGDEIALSIMAEIVQKRRTAGAMDLSHFEEVVRAEEVTIDPVCGMEVDVASATFHHRHEGRDYYFCCAGCQSNFASDPDRYLSQGTPSGLAIDPVCQMSVEVVGARHMSEYDGALFYFCCAGCKHAFDKDPESYAQEASARR
jgi:YHS domain-containing protein